MHNETIDSLFVRAKEIEKGEWIYGFYVNYMSDVEVHFIREMQYSKNEMATHWQIDPDTICMKIRDGFFEGDICKDRAGREYVLQYSKNPISFFAQTNYFETEDNYCACKGYEILDELTVIGTIYDDWKGKND